jgi:hypothetical protein
MAQIVDGTDLVNEHFQKVSEENSMFLSSDFRAKFIAAMPPAEK